MKIKQKETIILSEEEVKTIYAVLDILSAIGGKSKDADMVDSAGEATSALMTVYNKCSEE